MTMLKHHDTLFVDGEWIPSTGRTRLELVSPRTEEVVASVPAGTRDDVDRAVTAATRTLESGPWATFSPAERLSMLRRLSELLVEHQEELARLITEEMGCPISQSRSIQVVNPVRILDAYIDVAETYPFREVRRSTFASALVLREPVGVVAAVVPWNVPVAITIQKLAPALVAGCAVVLKPAPETPLDAYVVAQLVQEAGFPPGVVNVIPADREVSEYLVTHPGVAKVTFTGSSAAGRRIAELAGRDLRRVTLELGGKSAGIVLDDADLDLAVDSLRLGAFRNNGQICALKTRLLVPARLESEYLDRVSTLVDDLVIGDPLEPDTDIGPLVSRRQRERVEGYIASGKYEGATLIRGGGRPEDLHVGWYVEPTVFTRVDPEATIAQEEIFGPVVAVIPYETEEEAIAIANNSQYGLNGAVFTRDIDRGLRVASRIETGTVELNGYPAGFYSPMGGVKHSGLGREFGPEGIDPFIEYKVIGLADDIAAVLA